jgi:hypothetical protein
MRSTDSINRRPSPRGCARSVIAIVLLLSTLLGMSGCETLHTGSDYDRTANFSAYHTFAWLERAHYGAGNPLVFERAREAILGALEAKGYRYVSTVDAADFAVDFTIGAHQRLSVRTYPEPFGGPWSWYGRGWWGYPYWGTGVRVSRYREGVLSIDVFDVRTHRPVWHGWAKQRLSRESLAHSRQSIPTAVDAVLAKFPPP